MDHKEIKRLVENGKELKEFIEHKLPQLREEAKKSSVVGLDYVDTVKIEWEE